MSVMMKCGHSANAINAKQEPVCVICIGIHDGAETVDNGVSLKGRTACCSYFNTCSNETPSSLNLAFFEHMPDHEFDSFFCGCKGWD